MKFTNKNWKKNLTAAAVLLVVCVGIYMNWMYSNDKNVANLDDTLDADKVMSDDNLMLEVDGVLDAVEDTISDYFAAVRLSRQQARDSALEELQEAMAYDDPNGTSAAKLEEIVNLALCEAQIESLIIAKGYTDCVAYISDGGISVAVATPENGMQQSDVAVIADIVMTQTEFDYADIRVVEVQ